MYDAESIVIRETLHVLEVEVGAQREEEVLLLLGELRYLVVGLFLVSYPIPLHLHSK